MRISIDIPDRLFERLKGRSRERNMTLRTLVTLAIEREVSEISKRFQLRDASVGDPSAGIVSCKDIECHLADIRDTTSSWV